MSSAGIISNARINYVGIVMQDLVMQVIAMHVLVILFSTLHKTIHRFPRKYMY